MSSFARIVSILALVAVTLGLCLSCKESVPDLAFQPNPESTVPADFTTYAGEGMFSISYPSDWETDSSTLEEMEALAREWGKEAMDSPAWDEFRILFMAGKAVDQGLHPNVVLTVEPIPKNVSDIDELAYAQIKGLKEMVDAYEQHSAVKTIIDGRDAAILEIEADSGSVHVHDLVMCTMTDQTAWAVTCTLFPDLAKFEDHEQDFYSIVRSLRISE